jgi:hypothetical protein
VRVRFHERVLHGLVGVGRFAQVMVRNAAGATLMSPDELREAFPRVSVPPLCLEGLDRPGSNGIRFAGGSERR